MVSFGDRLLRSPKRFGWGRYAEVFPYNDETQPSVLKIPEQRRFPL